MTCISFRRPRSRGFTVIEILLVIALIGLFSTLFIVNLDALMRVSEGEAVETAFWEAAREARTRALVNRQPQALLYDEEGVAFVVEEQGTGAGRRFNVDRGRWTEDLEIEIALQKRLPASQFSLVRGQLVEMRDVAMVHFYPDGTCTPFVFSMKVGEDERTIEIDPWTGAELLEADEE
ncbi:MAG: pilus assembly FimT family protein [Opitutaceae bacterium]